MIISEMHRRIVMYCSMCLVVFGDVIIVIVKMAMMRMLLVINIRIEPTYA